MDDATFLRRLAERGRVALLADGSAVPQPQSVMNDESRAGSPFVIDLVSPTEVESGDGRSFKDGSITVRELPIPLMWQFQLDDGHKGAVIVGRIDFIEETERGLGNARGVFDSGPWGQEAERLVRADMLRGVSGDYSDFSARVTPAEREAADGDDPLNKNGEGDGSVALKDDKINVTASKLVAATLVSKPAFEGCYIRLADEPVDGEPSSDPVDDIDPDSLEYPDGVIEAAAPITAGALVAAGLKDMVDRIERLEALEMEILNEELALTASAIKQRVGGHRLQRERELALQRVRASRNITAGFGRMSHELLSAKAKLEPRDKHGRWIEMGSKVRWSKGNEPGSGFNRGKVESFDQASKLYKVKDLSSGKTVSLPGKSLEVVKAVIPGSEGEAHGLAPSLHSKPPSSGSVKFPEGWNKNWKPGEPDFLPGHEPKAPQQTKDKNLPKADSEVPKNLAPVKFPPGWNKNWQPGRADYLPENTTRGDVFEFKQKPTMNDGAGDFKPESFYPGEQGLVHEVKDGKAWVTFGETGGWVDLQKEGATKIDHIDFPDQTSKAEAPAETAPAKPSLSPVGGTGAESVAQALEKKAEFHKYQNADGYDRGAGGHGDSLVDAAKLIREKGATHETVAELRKKAKYAKDLNAYEGHNPFVGGQQRGYTEAADALEAHINNVNQQVNNV